LLEDLGEETPVITIRKILAPIDFTETSLHALDYAIELAQKLDAAVYVVHIYELPIYGFPDGALVASADLAGRISSAAQTALNQAVDSRVGRGVKLTAMLREGAPRQEINAVAQEVGADLIVIGTHGRRGIARALLGSVAEGIVRTATRPVVTVHRPDTYTVEQPQPHP
jgi:nucleotide-binding universal stress UspA family protein